MGQGGGVFCCLSALTVMGWMGYSAVGFTVYLDRWNRIKFE
jgi:hypothetical protein